MVVLVFVLLISMCISGGNFVLRRRRAQQRQMDAQPEFPSDVKKLFPHVDLDHEARSAPEIKAAAAAGRAAAADARRASASDDDGILPSTAEIIKELHGDDDDEDDPVGWADLPVGGPTCEDGDLEQDLMVADEVLAGIREEAAHSLSAEQGAAMDAALQAARLAADSTGPSVTSTERTDLSEVQDADGIASQRSSACSTERAGKRQQQQQHAPEPSWRLPWEMPAPSVGTRSGGGHPSAESERGAAIKQAVRLRADLEA